MKTLQEQETTVILAMGKELEMLRTRIAELEKDLHMIQRHYDQQDTSVEPWGWFNPHNLECGQGAVDWEDTRCIPLYTAPQTKLLSNDVIWAYAHLNKIKGNVVKFARALEKRILEK